MEQKVKQERQIVQWKVSNVNWSVEEFLETHPEYKKAERNAEHNFWPMIFTLADQLGIDENTMQELFDEKPECKITDLIFSLYLIKLYGRSAGEEFFNYKKTIAQGEVHGFLKGHEGLLQNTDTAEVKNASAGSGKNPDGEPAGANTATKDSETVTEADLKQCLQNLIQFLQQRESVRQEYEKAVERLIEAAEIKQTEKSALTNSETPERSGNTSSGDNSQWKRILKLEKENAVLRTQLEAEKKEAVLKYDSAMEMKRVEMDHLKKQMDLHISSIERLRKENLILKQNEGIRQIEKSNECGGLFRRKRKKQTARLMDERQELAMKIIGSTEYPDFLKEFIGEAYHKGMDLKYMQAFDNPKIERSNFEMMKAIV